MPDVSQRRTATLLIAHGSRRTSANADLVQLAEIVRECRNFAVVEIAYLELAEPNIPAGAEACIRQGVDRVLMLPYFLSAGEHVGGDLEKYRREFSAAYPQVEFRLCAPLGLHPQVVAAVLSRLDEGLSEA